MIASMGETGGCGASGRSDFHAMTACVIEFAQLMVGPDSGERVAGASARRFS